MAEIVKMPKLGFDMKEGTLVRWVKMEGDSIQKGDVLAEIETDKATVEVEAPSAGILVRQVVEADSIVPIGDAIAVLAESGEEVDLDALVGGSNAKDAPAEKSVQKTAVEKKNDAVEDSSEEQQEGKRLKASPLARKMAEENELDLSKINGSGPQGRIIKKDIENALETSSNSEAVHAASVPQKTRSKDMFGLPDPVWAEKTVDYQDKNIPLNKFRSAIGRRLVESKQQIPHFYVTSSYNVEELLDLRKKANETLSEDQKLSVNDFILKAVALTLRQFPNINASISEKEIIQHGSVNVGVAVSVEGGLLTVVVKDADQKPLRLISTEIKAMVARARSGKIRPEDVEGSTFSISNMGMYAVENFAAIINPPEAAILAISAAREEPVVIDGQVAVGWRMKVTISADHRITDGVEAAQFMQTLGTNLEAPLRLLL